jgi:hypothetical protein
MAATGKELKGFSACLKKNAVACPAATGKELKEGRGEAAGGRAAAQQLGKN